MATPAWENTANPLQPPHPPDIDAYFKTVWDPLQRLRESWKCQQRLSLFDSYDTIKADQRMGEVHQMTLFRQLQSSYEKAETELVKWRQAAAMRNDSLTYGKCQEFLLELVKNSCICYKQPPPIVDGDSKRSRPQVEIRVLTGKISNILQDGQAEVAVALLTDEQARSAVEGKGVPCATDFSIDWHGKKPIPLSWDSTNRWFRARFTDLVLKKPAGQKWLDGYHLYFYSAHGSKKTPGGPVDISCLSTPFEVVSNRTGQKAHKMRNEFWRLAFCTNDSNSSTVSLKPTVPGEAFLDIFDRWYRGFTGIQNGLNEGHKRSIGHMLKIRDGVVTWERFKRNWLFLYHSAEYVKENTFLWSTGILSHCFATREEAEKILAQSHEKTMLIRFQQSAPGYLSISFIMPGDTPEDGRYFAHCPLESYFKRNYTLVQCIEFADLLSPSGKRLKARLRDFKILGANENFEYRQILEEDERTRERVYAMIQGRQAAENNEHESGERGPLVGYSTVKERFKIKTIKFPEAEFLSASNSNDMLSASPCIVESPFPLTPSSAISISPRSSIVSLSHTDNSASTKRKYSPDDNSFGAWNFGDSLSASTSNGFGQGHQQISTPGSSFQSPTALPFPGPPTTSAYAFQQQAPPVCPMNPNVPWQRQPSLQAGQELQTQSTDCTIVFDYRQQQTQPIGAGNHHHQMENNTYTTPYQPNGLDQTVTDEDLSSLLAAFDSFNNMPVANDQEHRFSFNGKSLEGLADQQAIFDYQRPSEFSTTTDDRHAMDFEMTSDFLVPNR